VSGSVSIIGRAAGISNSPAISDASWNLLLSRRDALRVGSLAVASSVLPGLRAATPAKAQSVLLLWMAGGVTHIDSFDPKPDAPSEVRGDLNSISTSLSGVRVCETMPQLAKAKVIWGLF
jgi:hypothetical protein